MASRQPTDNNFNLMRLIAASSVIFSHAADIATGREDSLALTIGYSGGWIAVSAFFTMSGYLIYKSAERSRSVTSFMVARCLRILPGLWAMLFFTTLGLGLVSTVPFVDYIQANGTLRYLLGNAILYFPAYLLPGVFEGNVLPGVVNGSLWTLRFEFTCYLVPIGLATLGVLAREKLFRTFIACVLLLYVSYVVFGYTTGSLRTVLYDGGDFAKMHRLFFAFLLGMLFARYGNENTLPFRAPVIAAIVAALSWQTPFFSTALILGVATFVLWFAFAEIPQIKWAQTMPDISYGIYIYAFPIQQLFAYARPDWTPMANACASLLVTIIPATLSWYIVEKPALKLKGLFDRKRAPA